MGNNKRKNNMDFYHKMDRFLYGKMRPEEERDFLDNINKDKQAKDKAILDALLVYGIREIGKEKQQKGT